MLAQERSPDQALLTALRTAVHYIFDVDGTLTERQQTIMPSLADTIAASQKKISIATSRACDELDEVFQGCGYTRQQLVTGPTVLEDGGVLILAGQAQTIVMVPDEQKLAVQALMAHIGAHIETLPGDKWGRLGDIDFPLVHVPTYYDYQVSGSVWQQVLNGTPAGLDRTMDWVERAAHSLSIRGLVDLTEIGDGTLRVSAPGRSKGVALKELHEQGLLDLSKSAYFCDGRNDLPAAEEMRAHGGKVIVVDSRCPELMALADFITSTKGPRGLERLMRMVR